MSYPVSSDVAAAQPTLAAQYNNLRADAIRLGQAPADTVDLAQFLKRYVQGVKLTYLATNRLRVNYDASLPPSIMINGFMLQAYENVDLASGLFSGAAATWYVFAVRNAGSSTFTLSVNTSPVEGTDQRLIGQVQWDGTNIISVTTLVPTFSQLPQPDYDSGWIATGLGASFYQAHNMAQLPRMVKVLHAINSLGTGEIVDVTLVQYSTTPTFANLIHYDTTNIIITTGPTGTMGTCYSTRRQSNAGYYRILGWK